MLPLRFYAKVEVNENDCHEWAGALTSGGYGRYKTGGKTRLVHRVAYEDVNGSIPDGLVLDHLCRNRRCVNPKHLEAVTIRENVVVRGETITARNATKTECVYGHPLSGDNLFIRTTGQRLCMICKRATQHRLRDTDEFRQKHAAYEYDRRRRQS